ncbi:anthranilate synthase component I [Paenibacillus sp. MMS18-CY102]|uniref:anthranilate synthase component I n=1 Tax=Paenibacillus sp. MMS18-CY102 TaxID=2682849 RepID=UPI0013660DDD|nr:anthranilate synthase component I [Paenibacillus sp. MMS18-CY102]MWC31040.1 anthranilate synthase component I [Paenibacillus sp. MMS18-CY102]
MNPPLFSTNEPQIHHYSPSSGNTIKRTITFMQVQEAIPPILEVIDERKGALFTSRFEYPGRYSRWDIGFVNPPLEIRSFGNRFTIAALNERGIVLLKYIETQLQSMKDATVTRDGDVVNGKLTVSDTVVYEEQRTQQTSLFSVMRVIKDSLHSQEDTYLGLYGAFAYDLIFQFESIALNHARNGEQPDMVLYLPDELTVVDHQMSCAYKIAYDFQIGDHSTEGLSRTGERTARDLQPRDAEEIPKFQAGTYAKLVNEAIEAFKVGDLFEVVPSHTFYEPCTEAASHIFNQLMEVNPSPYCFIINLGTEHLVGTSPEMYVRVEGSRVETCPISGTIKRGASAIEDADQIRTLLNSPKEEAELTMCTDVDRNDKSRICIPGTVEVIGRRQLEMYSHLIHTVDHVEGRLDPQFDALDAFMTHMWAVTVTGAPKRAAVAWIEKHEDSPRGWYGGAVGYYAFNGDLNTGLTLRTVKIKNNIAEIRVGATLLYDSIPEEEEQETHVKAAALISVLRGNKRLAQRLVQQVEPAGKGKKVLLVDHEDSFVHTLASYFRQCGANVQTLRSPAARQMLAANEPFDLVVLSPGPGRPEQFDLEQTIALCIQRRLPIFGVCLGLQGIVEYFGGELGVLPYPQHGKPAVIHATPECSLWEGLPASFTVGRYHSLYAAFVPDCLQVAAETEGDHIVMAVEHKELHISAVQFHPESILTLGRSAGMAMVNNVLAQLPDGIERN